eukprot:34300-Alexandrium_andersonii.AAC.1
MQARHANDKTAHQYTNAALPPARYASEHVLDLVPRASARAGHGIALRLQSPLRAGAGLACASCLD